MSREFSRKVIHVDDDPAILRIVEHVLARRGYSVISVSDSNLALDALQTHGAKLVILDLDMPGKNGLELLEEIKEIDGSIQVLMLTGLVSMDTILRATRLGAEECQFKPIEDFEELGKAVDRAYDKMLRWWKTFREWKKRQKALSLPQFQDLPSSYLNEASGPNLD